VAWRAPSLRGRVAFLAGTVVVLLLVTLLTLIWLLRSSQANLVAQSNKHLQAVARLMAGAYENRPDRTISLVKGEPGPPPPGPGREPLEAPPPPPPVPQPPPPEPHPVPPPRPKPPVADDPGLAALTSRVLQDETGIEGGYYRANDQRLAGYAFPTHEGPGDPKAMPARETPIIQNVASAAVNQNKLQLDQFRGTHDVVLFMAVPVCETQSCSHGPVGAAWLMQRLPGVEADRKRTLLWSAFGFGVVACITVILAFLVLRQVDQGTQSVLDRLTRMETHLSPEDHPAAAGLAEFHRVLDGLDRLGDALRTQFEKERELQTRLRQSERLAAIGQLATGVAHELRNPLATIRLRAQMAQRRTKEEPVVQAAGVILAEVDRLDGIIERLLNFSRPIRLNLSQVDLSSLCASATERWKARDPEITFLCAGDSNVVVTADPFRLEQVVDNVLENAVHQLVETGTAAPLVSVRCTRNGDHALLEIQDNGGGFTSDALQNATEPFFTTRAKGTGLGLAIANEIVQALGATLHLRNVEKGAMVSITLKQKPGEDEKR
jgi:signal transduction histidine kinase